MLWIKDLFYLLMSAALMLAFAIVGVYGFALIHIAYLKPSTEWAEKYAERQRIDSLDALKDSAIVELNAHIIDRDTTKVKGWDSVGSAHVRRSSYWNE